VKTATRRAIIAAAGLSAAGTVAALALLRKPQGPAVATLVPGAGNTPPVKIGGVEQIRRTEPPAPPAPASFTDAEGTSQTLAAYAGKGLVVNLWATWCVPCVAEMPELATLARMVAPEGILVLPLSGDRGGAEVVQRFYTAHGIAGLPVLLDPKGTAARAWGARGLPTTLIIDRQGREQARVEGAIDWAGAAVVAEIRRLTA
jgi:thiol-disulfide isomerase/thioredoxin